jgi:hypothetical protein
MKKIILLFVFIAFGLQFCLAQEGSTKFKETSFDFGSIPSKGGKVTHEFEFTNTHASALVITNVKASCGCTTPFWTKEPVEPGKTGKITVTFDPSNYSSHFSKTITVNTNHEPSIQLVISGTAVREPAVKNPADDYMFPVGDGNYLLKFKSLDFGTVTPKQTKSVKMEVFNKSDRSISQKAATVPKYLTVKFDKDTVGSKTPSTVDVVFNAALSGYGHFKGELNLLVDGATVAIPYSATVSDVFLNLTAEQKSNAGKINFSATELKFESVKKEKSQILKFSNSGKSALNIHAITSSEPYIKVSKTKMTLKSGEIAEVKISIDASKVKSDFEATISVFSDDPKTPIKDIKITGNL